MDIEARRLRFVIDPFPSCCQAAVVHQLGFQYPKPMPSYAELKKLNISTAELTSAKSLILGNQSGMVFAVTASDQSIWEYVLEQLGFEKQRRYTARTGSLLTAWVFTPEDQEPEENDDDD